MVGREVYGLSFFGFFGIVRLAGHFQSSSKVYYTLIRYAKSFDEN